MMMMMTMRKGRKRIKYDNVRDDVDEDEDGQEDNVDRGWAVMTAIMIVME